MFLSDITLVLMVLIRLNPVTNFGGFPFIKKKPGEIGSDPSEPIRKVIKIITLSINLNFTRNIWSWRINQPWLP